MLQNCFILLPERVDQSLQSVISKPCPFLPSIVVKMSVLILLHTSDEQASCEEGSLRFQGGVDNSSGIVEYCKYRTWGTLCNDGWDNIDASVACRQLGFNPASM